MPRELKFQDPGEGIHEGEIADVLVSEGDEVQEGDDLLVVETDKATTELPSTYSGKIEKIHVRAGDVVEVGDLLVTFASGAGEEAQEEEAQDEEKSGGGKAAAVGELPGFEEFEEQETKSGRNAKADAKADRQKEKPNRKQPKASERPIPASPATRRLARELGIDLREVEPSGPHGRVIDDDVRQAAEEQPADKEETKAKKKKKKKEKGAPAEAAEPKAREKQGRERPELPDFERWGSVERQPLRGIRRQTARRMSLSWQEIPHVTHHDWIDVTDLERWRREHALQIEEQGGQLSLMVLVIKALAGLLRRYPRFNASFDPASQELILKQYYHLGVAVDTEDGLVVGVLRNVDREPVAQVARSVTELVERVRNREVESEELRGSTFTVSNVGPLGGDAFEPLVNYPEVAILGMGRARLQQVVGGDLDSPTTEVRYMLPLSLSYDHRVNDGADAARFLRDLGQALRDPETMLLNI